MESETQLSFIAPIYKTEAFLERFLQSYLSQTIIEKTELIIVDDASPDNSINIVSEVLNKDSKLKKQIKIIRHEKNKGLAAARQTGLDAATGKYVIFVDSDDFFEPLLAEKMLQKAGETDADIVSSDLYYEYLTEKKYVTCKYNKSKEKIINHILNNTIGNAGQYTRIVKRELFKRAKISFIPDINMFEDRILAIKLFSNAKKISYIHEAFYHYVQYNSISLTKKLSNQTVQEMIAAQNEINNYLLSIKESYKKGIYNFRCYIKFLLWISEKEENLTLSEKLYPEVTKKVLFSKSIPKFHTRVIFYNFLKGNKKTAKVLNSFVQKLKNEKKEQNTYTKIIESDFKYDVSVIIVNYNTRELLKNCLASLYEQTKDVSFEVLVSDNGSKDGSLDMVRAYFPQIKIIDNNANLGFGAANNRGLVQASGKYIFYLNSDTVVINNAVKIFFDYWESHKNENLGALGANLLDENNKVIHSAGTFRTIDTEIKDAFHDMLRTYKLITPFLKNKKMGKEPASTERFIGAVDYVTGADLFVKNNENAYFDERYFLYYEETDMQKRMALAGKERRLIEGPQIQHLKGGSDTSKAPINFYKGVSKINSLLSCCIFQHKYNKNPVKLVLLKLIITIMWLNPALVGRTGKYLWKLWRA